MREMECLDASTFVLAVIVLLFVASETFAGETILMEGKGFGNLIVGESRIADVVQSLGKPDFVEQTKAEYSRNYVYSELRLQINFHDDLLNTISTLPGFDGKTSRGITLNSSLEDIEKAYGSPTVAPGKTKGTAKVWAFDGVIFWLKKSRILNRFEGIETIVIFNKSHRRSEKEVEHGDTERGDTERGTQKGDIHLIEEKAATSLVTWCSVADREKYNVPLNPPLC